MKFVNGKLSLLEINKRLFIDKQVLLLYKKVTCFNKLLSSLVTKNSKKKLKTSKKCNEIL